MGNIPGYTPPPPDLVKRMRPQVRPGLVGGVLGHAQAQPDRRFLVLEQRKDGPDRVWEIDGYSVKDEVNQRENWRLVLICPICEQGLTLESTKKTMNVTEEGLEVETFRCAWHGDFGSLLCEFRAAIRLPKTKDEAIVRCDHDPMNPRKMDGVFVRV